MEQKERKSVPRTKLHGQLGGTVSLFFSTVWLSVIKIWRGSLWLHVAQCGSVWLHVALVRLKTSRRGALERGRRKSWPLSPGGIFSSWPPAGKESDFLVAEHTLEFSPGLLRGRLQSSQSDAVSVAGTLGPQDGAVASMDVSDRRDWGAWAA